MATVRFGTICDKCGQGSNDYACDACWCDDCGIEYCDKCAVATGHKLLRDWDVDQTKLWGCEDGLD